MSAQPTISDAVEWTSASGLAVWLDSNGPDHPWLQSLYLQMGQSGTLQVPVGVSGSDGCVACKDGQWIGVLSTGAVVVLG